MSWYENASVYSDGTCATSSWLPTDDECGYEEAEWGGMDSRFSNTVNDFEYMDPRYIQYTNDSCSRVFSDGGCIYTTAMALTDGDICAEDIPVIRVVEFNGNMYSLDNRRLWVFKESGIDCVPVDTLYNISKPLKWRLRVIESMGGNWEIRVRW